MSETIGDGERVPHPADAISQLMEATMVYNQMKSLVELRRAVEVFETMLQAQEMNGVTQSPPEGYAFLVTPYRDVQSDTYLEVDGYPNGTQHADQEYEIFSREKPFLADELIPSYSGVFAVNRDNMTCIVLEESPYNRNFVHAQIELCPITPSAE